MRNCATRSLPWPSRDTTSGSSTTCSGTPRRWPRWSARQDPEALPSGAAVTHWDVQGMVARSGRRLARSTVARPLSWAAPTTQSGWTPTSRPNWPPGSGSGRLHQHQHADAGDGHHPRRPDPIQLGHRHQLPLRGSPHRVDRWGGAANRTAGTSGPVPPDDSAADWVHAQLTSREGLDRSAR